MIRLYGTAISRANRCLWALEELGLAYEHVPTRFNEESKTREYLHINPNGRVPTLVDGDEVLWESIAINLYLADKYGAVPFWPRSPEERGKVYQWSLWAVNEIEPRASTLMAHRMWNPPEQRDPEVAMRRVNHFCLRATIIFAGCRQVNRSIR
jgi:glutathione S-transferase